MFCKTYCKSSKEPSIMDLLLNLKILISQNLKKNPHVWCLPVNLLYSSKSLWFVYIQLQPPRRINASVGVYLHGSIQPSHDLIIKTFCEQ